MQEERLLIHNLVKRDPLSGLADDVRTGLAAKPKRFLPKYFYDQLGSQLFEAICLLPEYYLTRAEKGAPTEGRPYKLGHHLLAADSCQ